MSRANDLASLADPDLLAIASLPETSGLLRKTGANSWGLDGNQYQALLISGTNIKTINGTSILGSGDINITAGVSSFNARAGDVTLSSSDVTGALGFMPYSAANPNGYISGISESMVISAIGYTPVNVAHRNATNGYAGLDSSGLIPSSLLPSFVDDVLEYASLASFPATGESGKIYVAIDNSKTYRWSGSVYVGINASPGSTDSLTEGAVNLYFTPARSRAAVSASGSLTYNSATGVISYSAPTSLSAFTNDSGYLTSASLAPFLTTASASSTYLPLAGGSISGNLNFSGSNQRITGDFTSTNRILVQTTSANSNTMFGLIPSGTAVNSQFNVWGAPDITNAPLGAFSINSSAVQIQSTAAGTGTILPFRVLVGSTEVFRATAGANFLIGSSTASSLGESLQVTGQSRFSNVAKNLVNGDDGTINVVSSDTQGGGKGGTITLGGMYDGSSITRFAAIGGFKDSSTSGEFGGYLAFFSRAHNSQLAERGRIAASGNWIIGGFGVDDGINKLQVSGTIRANGAIETRAGGFIFPDGTTQTTAATGGGSVATPTALGTVYGKTTTAFGSSPYSLTALGHDAALYTTGMANTAIGRAALLQNTSGNYNTAVGFQALINSTTASSNTAIGSAAGEVITTGQFNACIGQNSFKALTTGNSNTAIGMNAGDILTTGIANIYIGSFAVASGTNVSRELVIGAQELTYVYGKGSNTGFIFNGGGGTYQGNNSSSWSTTSDRRLKKNIVDNNDGLEEINLVRVRNFEYRLPEEVDAELKPSDAIKKSGVQLGVIAQELQAVLPDCVKQESTGVLSVDTDNLTWYLVNAVKKLTARVTQLEVS
jgi:Chaperone of endosialidase